MTRRAWTGLAAGLFLTGGLRGAAWDYGGGPGRFGDAAAACRDMLRRSSDKYNFAGVKPTEIEGTQGCYASLKGGDGPFTVGAVVEIKDAPAPPDKFQTECIPEYFSTDFETELDDEYRKGVKLNGNVGVVEWYNEDGERQAKAFSSSADGHSEQQILAFLLKEKVPKDRVTRIFSELSPCVNKCLPKLSKHFEGVRSQVTLEFHWLHDQEQSYKTCPDGNGQSHDARTLRQEKKQERIKRVAAQ